MLSGQSPVNHWLGSTGCSHGSCWHFPPSATSRCSLCITLGGVAVSLAARPSSICCYLLLVARYCWLLLSAGSRRLRPNSGQCVSRGQGFFIHCFGNSPA